MILVRDRVYFSEWLVNEHAVYQLGGLLAWVRGDSSDDPHLGNRQGRRASRQFAGADAPAVAPMDGTSAVSPARTGCKAGLVSTRG